MLIGVLIIIIMQFIQMLKPPTDPIQYVHSQDPMITHYTPP